MLRKLVVAATAVLAVVAFFALPLGADAQRKRTIRFTDATAKVRFVDTRDGKAVFAGTVRGAPLGLGAVVVEQIRTEGNVVTIAGKAYYPHGTLNVRFTDTITTNPDGSLTFTSDDGRITGGTGRYRRATGSFTFNGTAPSADAPQTHKLNGSFSYTP